MTEPRVEALLRNEPIPGLPEEVRVAAGRRCGPWSLTTPPLPTAPTPLAARPSTAGAAAGSPCSPEGWSWPAPGRPPRSWPRAQPDDPEIVRCFSVAAPPFTSGAPGSYDASYGPGDGTLDQSAALAIELCGYGWAEGRLPWPETKPPGYTNPQPQPVPELQACILPDGIVGVFPGDERTCTQLGLPGSAA